MFRFQRAMKSLVQKVLPSLILRSFFLKLEKVTKNGCERAYFKWNKLINVYRFSRGFCFHFCFCDEYFVFDTVILKNTFNKTLFKWSRACVFAGLMTTRSMLSLNFPAPFVTQNVSEWERGFCLWIFSAQHQCLAQPQRPAEEGRAVWRHRPRGGPALPCPPVCAGGMQQLPALETRRPGWS